MECVRKFTVCDATHKLVLRNHSEPHLLTDSTMWSRREVSTSAAIVHAARARKSAGTTCIFAMNLLPSGYSRANWLM